MLTQLKRLNLAFNNLWNIQNWHILNNLPQLQSLDLEDSIRHAPENIRDTNEELLAREALFYPKPSFIKINPPPSPRYYLLIVFVYAILELKGGYYEN